MQARASGIELCRVLAMLTLFPVPCSRPVFVQWLYLTIRG